MQICFLASRCSPCAVARGCLVRGAGLGLPELAEEPPAAATPSGFMFSSFPLSASQGSYLTQRISFFFLKAKSDVKNYVILIVDSSRKEKWVLIYLCLGSCLGFLRDLKPSVSVKVTELSQ